MNLTRKAVLAVALTVAACGPYVHFTELDGPMPPREGLEAVAVLNTHVPECPYTELGIVSAFAGKLGTRDGALDALKRRALEVGGDAIIAIQAVNSGGEDPKPGYSATVIRFDQSDCTR